MNEIIEFIGNNYAWFLTITILLLFALIGYIYDSKNSKLEEKNKEELDNLEEVKDTKEEVIVHQQEPIDNINNLEDNVEK